MQNKDPFDTLGVPPGFDLDLEAVEKRHRELSRTLHPDRYAGRPAAERRQALGHAIEVNEAWRVLKDPVRRAEALLARLGVEVPEGQEPPATPELLMGMMELRESLSEARQNQDLRSVAALARQVRDGEERVLAQITERFGQARAHNPDGAVLIAKDELMRLLGELRYHRRFLQEAAAIEDELG
jgi:molecular chaperone HscB